MKPVTHRSLRAPALLWVLLLLASGGCAWVAPRSVGPPLNRQQIETVIASFKDQESAVQTLFASGNLTLESQGAQSDAEVLVAARREPLAVRIEVTHAWGRPLLHICLKGSRLDVVSFQEKRHYTGRLDGPRTIKWLPFPLHAEAIWSIARGYPILPPYHQARSTKGRQIVLTDKGDAVVQVIDLCPDALLPQKVWMHREEMALRFFGFEDAGGILYAEEIQWADGEQRVLLTIRFRDRVFNRPLPEAIFEQEAPDFEEIPLEAIGALEPAMPGEASDPLS